MLEIRPDGPSVPGFTRAAATRRPGLALAVRVGRRAAAGRGPGLAVSAPRSAFRHSFPGHSAALRHQHFRISYRKKDLCFAEQRATTLPFRARGASPVMTASAHLPDLRKPACFFVIRV